MSMNVAGALNDVLGTGFRPPALTTPKRQQQVTSRNRKINFASNKGRRTQRENEIVHLQCDQIGRLFVLWQLFKAFSNHLKPLATITLPKSPTFLGNFCKGVKIYHFSSEIIFGQLL